MSEMSTTEALDILGSLHKRYKAIEHGIGLMEALATAESRANSAKREIGKLSANVSSLEAKKKSLEGAVRKVSATLKDRKSASDEKLREIEKEERARIAEAKADADGKIKAHQKRAYDVREAVGAEIKSLETDAKTRRAELAAEETRLVKDIDDAKKDLAKLRAEATRIRNKLIEGASA